MPFTTLPQIQTDLDSMTQGPRETVSEFGLRMKRKLNQAFELSRETLPESEIAVIIKILTNTAIEGFKIGLRKEISDMMTLVTTPTLNIAIEIALKIERNSAQNFELHKNNRFPCKMVLEERTNKEPEEPTRCYSCGQEGHFYKQCKTRRERRSCNYCKKPGHLIRDCWTRKNRNLQSLAQEN